jgi:hypothetical protein
MNIYGSHFNANEYLVLLGLLVGLLFVVFLPKRFSSKDVVIYFMTGVFSGFFFDHMLSIQPIKFYDVNDTSMFQLMDFVTYWIYGPFSYIYFYVLDYLHVKKSFIPSYILACSLIAVLFEGIGVHEGVYHYTHGYKIYYSFGIYLLVLSAWTWLFYQVQSTSANSD